MSDSIGPSLFPWRPPLAADWIERWTAIDGLVRLLAEGGQSQGLDEPLGISLRRLANQQLGPSKQIKLENLAGRIPSHIGGLEPLQPIRLGLIGSRNLSFLGRPLRAAGLARGLLVDVVSAPYDAIARFVHGGDPFDGATLDAVAVVPDRNAFTGPASLSDAAEAGAVASADHLLTKLSDAARKKTGASPIIATIPLAGLAVASVDVAMPGAPARFAMRLNGAIAEGAARREWLVWDLAGLAARIGHDRWIDPVRFHGAKAPFAIALCPLVADHLCAILAARGGKSGRALVLDLDNTLWGGEIGDDGLAGIRIGQNTAEGEAFLAFQEFVLELRRRGVVLAVCSKNTDAIAREPFRAHPDMLLREEHLAVFRANWEDKASNVRVVAEALNLGMESIVFVDDNPAERARVRQELPLVNVPEVGSDPAYYPRLIVDSGSFEHLLLTREDLVRAENYRADTARAAIREQAGNYDDYLQSLRMTMTISRFDAIGRQRIVQLINKSNQFNLTTRRYGEQDVQHFEEDRDGVLCWQVRLSDAFSEHGIVAVVIVRKTPDIWSIDTWLQSCRILTRGVEQAIMNGLMVQARMVGVKDVTGAYIASARNELVRDFYLRMGFEECVNAQNRFHCNPSAFRPLEHFIDVAMTGQDA